MAASSKRDVDLSEAAFHSRYGYMAGWDDARDVVREAMEGEKNPAIKAVLDAIFWKMSGAERNVNRDAYVDRIDL